MESIVQTIMDVQGHTYDTILDLVFTNRRLMILQILSPNDGRNLRAAPTILSLFIGSAGTKRTEALKRYQIASERRGKLRHLDPEQIANEEECILDLPYNHISRVSFSQSILGKTVKFRFTSEGAEHSMMLHPNKEQYTTLMKLIGELAPEALKGSK